MFNVQYDESYGVADGLTNIGVVYRTELQVGVLSRHLQSSPILSGVEKKVNLESSHDQSCIGYVFDQVGSDSSLRLLLVHNNFTRWTLSKDPLLTIFHFIQILQPSQIVWTTGSSLLGWNIDRFIIERRRKLSASIFWFVATNETLKELYTVRGTRCVRTAWGAHNICLTFMKLQECCTYRGEWILNISIT